MFTLYGGKINIFDRSVALQVHLKNPLSKRSYSVDCTITASHPLNEIDPGAYGKRFENLRNAIERCSKEH